MSHLTKQRDTNNNIGSPGEKIHFWPKCNHNKCARCLGGDDIHIQKIATQRKNVSGILLIFLQSRFVKTKKIKDHLNNVI